MANFKGSGFTLPSPSTVASTSATAGYAPPFPTNFIQFTPNSTTGPSNIQFPSPPVISPMMLNGAQNGILSSNSDSRPTMSLHHGDLSRAFSQRISPWPWMQTAASLPQAHRFNAAAASFSSSLINPAPNINRASPVPSTSGWPNCTTNNKSKRKGDAESYEESPAVKIVVNEEHMAARLEELHLDNNNLDWHPDLQQQQTTQQQQQNGEPAWYRGVDASTMADGSEDNSINESRDQSNNPSVMLSNCSTSSSEDDQYDSDSSGSPRPGHRRQRSKSCPKLQLSKELKLQTDLDFALKTKSRLPEALLKELTKPCMQVVLWKPSGGNLHEMMTGVHTGNGCATHSNTDADITVGDPAPELKLPVQVSDSGCDDLPAPVPVSPSVWSIPVGESSSSSSMEASASSATTAANDDVSMDL